jgi:hypothetical protein
MSKRDMTNDERIDDALQHVDSTKRAFLKALVMGTAFGAPMVVSFSMKGISTYEVHAQDGSNLPQPSDRAVKEAFAPIDPAAILGLVTQLPIETWQYRGQSVRHIGPMAQDFVKAFNVGPDDRHIDLIDANGVALAAIQALALRCEAQSTELAGLRARLARLEQSS